MCHGGPVPAPCRLLSSDRPSRSGRPMRKGRRTVTPRSSRSPKYRGHGRDTWPGLLGPRSLLLLLYHLHLSEAVVPLEERIVPAWDCSAPAHLEPVQEGTPQYCKGSEFQPVSRTETPGFILQKARYASVKASVCREVRMVNTYYCGNYDHQTRVPQLSFPELRPHITPERCMQWHSEKMWRWKQPGNNRKFSHPLYMGQTMVQHVVTVGQYDLQEDHVDCTGETVVFRDETGTGDDYHAPLEDANQDVQFMITIEQVELRVDLINGTVHYPAEGRILEEYPRGTSTQPGETILWPPPHHLEVECPYYNVQRSNSLTYGALVRHGDGDLWFEADGDAHVRLKLKEPSFRICSADVYETNYDLLYFAPGYIEDHPYFRRPLPLFEISMSTFVNQQDAYIYDVLSAKIALSARQQMEFICNKEEADRQTKLARITSERAAALDGETVRVDEYGWFITRAGDGWHRYRCRRLLVHALEVNACYVGLPVALNSSDYFTYRRVNYMGPPEKTPSPSVVFNSSGVRHHVLSPPPGSSPLTQGEGTDDDQLEQEDPIQFFITPVSHRLTTVGIPRFCARLFPSLYKNAQGNWLSAGPQLNLLVNAQVRTVHANLSLPDVNIVPDFNAEGGGLYSAADLRQQEEMVLTPRWVQDVTHKLANTAMHSNMLGDFNRDPTAKTLLKNLPTYGWAWLGSAYELVVQVASVLAIVSGLFLAFKMLRCCCGMSLRCCSVLSMYGPWTMALFPAIAPSVWDWRERTAQWFYRNRHYHRARQEEDEPGTAMEDRGTRPRKTYHQGSRDSDRKEEYARPHRQIYRPPLGEKSAMRGQRADDTTGEEDDSATMPRYENVAPAPRYPHLADSVAAVAGGMAAAAVRTVIPEAEKEKDAFLQLTGTRSEPRKKKK